MTGPAPIQTGPCQPWTDPDEILACCGSDLDAGIAAGLTKQYAPPVSALSMGRRSYLR